MPQKTYSIWKEKTNNNNDKKKKKKKKKNSDSRGHDLKPLR